MVGFGGGRAGRQHQIEGGKDAQGQARLCFIGTSIGGAERSFALAAHRRRLIDDHEHNANTLAGLRAVTFVCLMLEQDEI
ncbi:hypothetical protein ACFQWF_08350 [Methylorubrum suomiense]